MNLLDILLFPFTLFIDTPGKKGKRGEKIVSKKLAWSNFLGYKGKQLRNIYVPKKNGGTTEIDLLYITVKGIFVIENKNYIGYIFGNEKNQFWTKTLFAGKDWLGRKKVKKYKFYNPLWQNRIHIRYLKQYLGEPDLPCFSLVVFSDECALKDITFNDSVHTVCQEKSLPRVIRRIWKDNSDVLSSITIDKLVEKLLPLTHQTRAQKNGHIEDIENKRLFYQTHTAICPRCGAPLVLRTARQGPSAGSRFYGCSNFPKCRYTKSIVK